MILSILASASAGGPLRFTDLGLHPDVFPHWHPFGFVLRWYSLAYIGGILLGWWYLLRLIARPGAPMGRRHADDLVFYATLGIILGGRIGYILFYGWSMFAHPLQMLRLWDGGMSFHGGLVGTIIGIWYLARRHHLSMLRICDYVACVAPIGQCLGRLANFNNGELWGRPTDVPWAIRFVEVRDNVAFLGPARHPSQLYEALGEGILLFALLAWLFWRTQARYKPGLLVGTGLVGFSLARVVIEFFREPDAQFAGTLFARWGFHMGQFLTLPMIVGGLYLIATAARRRIRVVPIAGSEAVA